MRFLDLILKKRNGCPLSKKEIEFFISGYVKGEIPDYQVSALLMAICFTHMNHRETADLTFAMRDSGDVMDLTDIQGIKADKHSTGGVADTTTLVCAPLVSACGLKVAKMSGRGLGHTGGTLDKLESIPGFSTSFDMRQFKQMVSAHGLSIIGQTQKLVPADKLLYALRNVTGTVDSTALIAASIMSKKLASGSDVIVLDVKTGNGAFMQKTKEAVRLAQAMVDIGKKAKKNIMALVTDMNQPLGNAIGNALEVREAIEILQGLHQGDLKTVSLNLAANMLVSGKVAADVPAAFELLEKAISSGSALAKLSQMIQAQGGDVRVCHDTRLLPGAKKVFTVTADQSGYIEKILTSRLGACALLLGAGRAAKDDEIDHGVGIWMKVRRGDYVGKNDMLAQFHVNDPKNLDLAIRMFKNALVVKDHPPRKRPLIYNTIA